MSGPGSAGIGRGRVGRMPWGGGDLIGSGLGAGETFEGGWHNDTFILDWVDASPSSAVFSGLFAETFDGFEHFFVDAIFAVDGGDGSVVVPGHPFVVHDRVQFVTSAGSSLPSNISADATYYVVAVPSSSKIVVAITDIGPPISVANDASGVNFIHAPFEFWTDPLGVAV